MTDTQASSAPGASGGGAARTEHEFTVKERTQTQLILRRFLRHRAAMTSLVIFLLIVVWAFVAPHFWHYSYGRMTPDNSQAPSGKHPFGTDSTGIDAYAQVMRGTQTSLKIAIMIALGSTAVGAVWEPSPVSTAASSTRS